MTLFSRVAAGAAGLCVVGAAAIATPVIATEDAGAAIVARAVGLAADVSLTTDRATDAVIEPATASTATAAIGSTAIDAANGTASVASTATASTAFASLNAAVAAQPGAASPDSELECLAGATYFESKGEPLEGQLAVAEVIINRSKSGRFPSTLCGVVHQRGQFSFVRGGRMPTIDRDSRAWREAVAVARIAQEEAWESRASDAMFFHARRVSPGWRKARVATLGNHVFYR